jgi:hypothetical protein
MGDTEQMDIEEVQGEVQGEVQHHDNVYDECLEIIKDKNTFNHNDLNDKWEKFKQLYPQLYSMIIMSDNIDVKLLKFLCDTAKKQNNLSNKDEKLENEFKVGDMLANKYIYANNKFPKPSPQQKELIKETIKKKIEKSQS